MIALTWNFENEIGVPNLTMDEQGRPQFKRTGTDGVWYRDGTGDGTPGHDCGCISFV